MIARTAGPCVGDCGGRIHRGDEIEGVPGEGWRHVECGHVDRGDEIEGVPGEGWRHVECGHVDRGQETIDLDPKTACPDCHLVHAGECY